MSRRTQYPLLFFIEGSQVSLFVLLPFIQKDFNISLFAIGIYGTLLLITSIISAFSSGMLAEKIGSRNVILISITFSILAWLLLALSPSASFIWIAFAMYGITNGLFSPMGNALVARSSQSHNRGKVMGDYKAVGDIGKVVMTSLTAFLAGILLWKLTSLLYVTISLGFIFLYFFIQKRRNHEHLISEEKIPTKLIHFFSNRKYVLSIFVGVFDSFSSSSLFIFLPFLLIPKGIDIKAAGFFTALFFLGYFAGRILLGRTADKIGKPQILIFSEICMSFLIMSLIFLQSYWLIMVNLFLLGMFTRGTSPIIKAMTADALNDHEFEKGFSLYSSIVKTANMVSRPVFGFIAGYAGIQNVFFLAGFVSLLTIVPAIKYYRLK